METVKSKEEMTATPTETSRENIGEIVILETVSNIAPGKRVILVTPIEQLSQGGGG